MGTCFPTKPIYIGWFTEWTRLKRSFPFWNTFDLAHQTFGDKVADYNRPLKNRSGFVHDNSNRSCNEYCFDTHLYMFSISITIVKNFIFFIFSLKLKEHETLFVIVSFKCQSFWNSSVVSKGRWCDHLFTRTPSFHR